jgi:hypothetical protein
VIRWLLLCVMIATPALAEEDFEKDLRDLQKDAAGILQKLDTKNLPSGSEAASGAAGQLDVARRKVFALASDKQFLKAMNDLWASPDRNKLLIVQGIFFVVIFLLRAWRQAKAANWFTRILVSLCFTIILWGGLSYVIPAIVLGEPYRIFVASLWRTLVSA